MCQRYDIAVKIVLSYLIEQGFSRTVRKEFRRASREFARYLDARHLTYSDARRSRLGQRSQAEFSESEVSFFSTCACPC